MHYSAKVSVYKLAPPLHSYILHYHLIDYTSKGYTIFDYFNYINLGSLSQISQDGQDYFKQFIFVMFKSVQINLVFCMERLFYINAFTYVSQYFKLTFIIKINCSSNAKLLKSIFITHTVLIVCWVYISNSNCYSVFASWKL